MADVQAPLAAPEPAKIGTGSARLLAAYETIFLVTPPDAVKRVLTDLEARGHVRTSIDPQAGDLCMAFAEGQRDLALHILRRIEDARAGKHRETPPTA